MLRIELDSPKFQCTPILEELKKVFKTIETKTLWLQVLFFVIQCLLFHPWPRKIIPWFTSRLFSYHSIQNIHSSVHLCSLIWTPKPNQACTRRRPNLYGIRPMLDLSPITYDLMERPSTILTRNNYSLSVRTPCEPAITPPRYNSGSVIVEKSNSLLWRLRTFVMDRNDVTCGFYLVQVGREHSRTWAGTHCPNSPGTCWGRSDQSCWYRSFDSYSSLLAMVQATDSDLSLRCFKSMMHRIKLILPSRLLFIQKVNEEVATRSWLFIYIPRDWVTPDFDAYCPIALYPICKILYCRHSQPPR